MYVRAAALSPGIDAPALDRLVIEGEDDTSLRDRGHEPTILELVMLAIIVAVVLVECGRRLAWH